MRNWILRFSSVLALAWCLPACGNDTGVSGGECFDSTFAAIQSKVFDARGCTSSTCHGSDGTLAGRSLLLQPGVTYTNMLRQPASSHGTLNLIEPNDEELSVLYLKLEARTNGTSLSDRGVSGSGMPLGGDAVSAEELGHIRTWIRAGAPETGVVAGTEAFLGCSESPPADPAKVAPLDPPPTGEGVQLYSGAWDLSRESEDEVCFVTYYDFDALVPENARLPCPVDAWGPDRDCFGYGEIFLAQDAQSHHAIIQNFVPTRFEQDHPRYDPAHPDGNFDPLHPDWKEWRCLGGEKSGEACDPMAAGFCGARSACGTVPATAVGCIAYTGGPPEIGALDVRAITDPSFGQRRTVAVVQEFLFTEEMPSGVYATLPVEGYMIWNSHAFNLTTKDTTIEQYLNLHFVDAADRAFPREEIFDAGDLFGMTSVAPFTEREICRTFTMPLGGRLLTLSSHMHSHGRLFRIWAPPNQPCEVGPDCTPPEDEPMYVSKIYDDPLYLRYQEPNLPTFDGDEASRTFKYCAIYDNGATEKPVKRNSERPDANTCALLDLVGSLTDALPPGFTPPGSCGCANEELACIGGDDQGALCGGDDAACGGGGECDACPLWGGVTTEDEMFLLLGSYYVDAP